ncbi:MAG: hypothetical protein MZU84_04055 [Sphingobacterium sp.]|nr:hypothetical protein [Sphingobacterium sp.]
MGFLSYAHDDPGRCCRVDAADRSLADLPRGPAAARLPHHVPVAEDRRQGDPAQEPEPDLLPDQRRRPRGGPGRRPACCLRPGYDWFFPYYRDRALLPGARRDAATRCSCRRSAPTDDPASGGRQMPSHWGHRRLNIVSQAQPHRHAVPAGRRVRRGRACSTSAAGHRRPRRRASRPTRSRYVLARRRHDQRGRVLGVAQHRLHRKLPGRLPRRGQRLRDLGAGRGADAPAASISQLRRGRSRTC